MDEIMKNQCRTCGEWFLESDMINTDYRTYAQQGDLDEMVCEGCYDNSYGKCTECGAVRELIDLNGGVCDQEQIDHATGGDCAQNYNTYRELRHISNGQQ